MQDSYVIIWVTKSNHRSGIGKKRFTKEEAELLSAELNNDYPEFVHRALNTETEEATTALLALQESLTSGNEAAVPLPGFASLESAA